MNADTITKEENRRARQLPSSVEEGVRGWCCDRVMFEVQVENVHGPPVAFARGEGEDLPSRAQFSSVRVLGGVHGPGLLCGLTIRTPTASAAWRIHRKASPEAFEYDRARPREQEEWSRHFSPRS